MWIDDQHTTTIFIKAEKSHQLHVMLSVLTYKMVDFPINCIISIILKSYQIIYSREGDKTVFLLQDPYINSIKIVPNSLFLPEAGCQLYFSTWRTIQIPMSRRGEEQLRDSDIYFSFLVLPTCRN